MLEADVVVNASMNLRLASRRRLPHSHLGRVEVDQKEMRIMGSKSLLLRTLVAASSAKTAGFGVPSSVAKWRATSWSLPVPVSSSRPSAETRLLRPVDAWPAAFVLAPVGSRRNSFYDLIFPLRGQRAWLAGLIPLTK
jgi:hypothetical protein